MIKNTDQRYGLISKALHWGMALVILSLLGAGFFMTDMDFSPFKLEIYALHKSFGMLILMLFGLRILWRSFSVTPDHLQTHATWERGLSKVIHLLLYISMVGMPLSGWIMSSAGDFTNSFFGLFVFPDLVDKDEQLFELMREVHELLAFALLAAITLHMAGAFKHHFIDRDETLKRMTSDRLGLLAGLVLVLLAGGLWFFPVGLAFTGAKSKVQSEDAVSTEKLTHDGLESTVQKSDQSWVIDKENSYIEFEATQYDEPFTGRFESFSGDIIFDHDDLINSRVEIEIDITSIKTGSTDRDSQALDLEWFNSDKFPNAVFKATEFLMRKPNHTNPNHYEARGDLTLRGVTLPLILPFSLVIDENAQGQKTAQMNAEIILNRLDYGVGQGQWESTETIGGQVFMKVFVKAYK
ncbi:MAG: cytochrome b/b6 domain-containing protein [Pseudomonadota bacterium]